MSRIDALDGTQGFRGDLGPYVTFDDLVTNTPAWARTQARIDPFYSNLWDAARTANWTDKRSLKYAVERGESTRKIQRCIAEVNPRDVMHNRRSGAFVRDTLAAALMWRITTSDQMAALTGHRSWLHQHHGNTPTSADRMVASAMLRIGTVAPLIGFRTPPTLVAPGRLTSWQHFAATIDYSEWLSITAGQSIDATSSSLMTRHNIAMTELGLRIAQFAPIAGITGEGCGRHDVLVPGLVGQNIPHASKSFADAVIATHDGRLIAIEMTVRKQNADEKVRRWAQTLAYDKDQRLSVLFVTAPAPGAPRATIHRTRHDVAMALEQVNAQTFADYRDRFFVSDWEQWFPGHNTVSSRFASLPAQRWNGQEWEWTNLLDSHQAWQPPSQRAVDEARMTIGAMSVLRGVPFWLRDEHMAQAMRKRLDVVSVASNIKALPVMPYASGETKPEARASWLYPSDVFDEFAQDESDQ